MPLSVPSSFKSFLDYDKLRATYRLYWAPLHQDYHWKQYLKIGTLSRYCAYCIEAFSGCINSDIQERRSVKPLVPYKIFKGTKKETRKSSSLSDGRSSCQKQFSQYTCPRCNARYCSLPCYKRHSLRCTESFMRENVMEELRHIQPEDETKRKMVELLKRFHLDELDNPFETEIDEDDSLLSEDTIQKIMRGDIESLDDLSNEEKKQFQRAVASGELGKLIEPWRPWWCKPSARTISLSREGAQLVQPIIDGESTGASGRVGENDPCDIPTGPEAPLRPVSELTGSDPSPLLRVHLIDVIYTYCFTLRLYNGEWQSDPLGASLVALNMSSVLSEGGQPETVAEALSWCLEKTCSPAYRDSGGLHFGLGLFDDVVCLLSLGAAAMVTMLCDLKRLIDEAIGELKSKKHDKGKTNSRNRSRLKSTSKKVYFLMCWVHEQPGEGWASLTATVELEKAAIAPSSSRVERLKIQGKTNTNHKVLIEEI